MWIDTNGQRSGPEGKPDILVFTSIKGRVGERLLKTILQIKKKEMERK